jgi:hypothetical protein
MTMHTYNRRASAFAEDPEESPVSGAEESAATEKRFGGGSKMAIDTDNSTMHATGSLAGMRVATEQHVSMPLQGQGSEGDAALTAAQPELEQMEVAGSSVDADVPENAHRFSWCVLTLASRMGYVNW